MPGNSTDFEALLARSGLSKRELAARLRLNKSTPSDWKDKPPGYAVAYLELLIRAKSVTEGIR